GVPPAVRQYGAPAQPLSLLRFAALPRRSTRGWQSDQLPTFQPRPEPRLALASVAQCGWRSVQRACESRTPQAALSSRRAPAPLEPLAAPEPQPPLAGAGGSAVCVPRNTRESP